MTEAAEAAGPLEERGAEGEGAGARQLRSSELSARRLKKLQDAHRQRGVIYINRIPPHMKPHKVRHLLSKYGKLGRIYLAPEDKAARSRRKKSGKDTGKNFSEGWVEFEDKREAKQVALMLNSNPIGGKRRSAHHDDLWCLKYLPKFKWDHLTEEMAYQNAVREQRLAQEISAANRERDFYLSRVNAAKGIAAQAERKRKRLEQQEAAVIHIPSYRHRCSSTAAVKGSID
ncbi:hypothetical protein WJX73_010342 [Symbiochloris irregularis]|uniref:RRM domain-containing protein n=1 Tax=Symbiochloris irregularis TaxID=706552 RepID=A0AAW1NS67_9CHLO